MSLLIHTPAFDDATAKSIVTRHYQLAVSQISELPSERDQNFKVITLDGDAFVLKIANGLESPEFLAAQHEMMSRLHKAGVGVPKIIPARDGTDLISFDQADPTHLVRLVSFIKGSPLSQLQYRHNSVVRDLGRTVGRFRNALKGFDHPALHREFHWDLASAKTVVDEKLSLLSDPALKNSIAYCVEQFERHTSPVLDDLPKSVIHNDFNDGNVIIANDSVAGVIDFGDSVVSWSIGELAIAIAYTIFHQDDPLSLATVIVAACHEESSLSDAEIEALFGLICMRLCVSATLAADQQRLRPDDPYLSISQAPIRKLLPKLMSIPYQIATTSFRRACGLTNQFKPTNAFIRQHTESFTFPIVVGVPNEAATSPLERPQGSERERNAHSQHRPEFCMLDFSVASKLLPPDLEATPMSQLTTLCCEEMQDHQSQIGIGRYLEPRLVYSAQHFGPEDLALERRTIHLGVDLFAPADTRVVAPLDGIVECCVKINLPLDYGNLIILKHEPATGMRFYTLFGHLADKTLDHVSVGQQIRQGDTLGWLGTESENGGWAPHLHFQIMHDLLDFKQDFPGVCVASQVNAWKDICPNPNWILGVPDDVPTVYDLQIERSLVRRSEHVGPGLSIAYDHPVKTLRGWKHWLFDYTGRKYLDAYNNVPHVGHCHPQIVEAIHEQAQLLNTNTRYINDSLHELAQRLSATMPAGLDICYFVNSASEANELALRLARTATGQKDMIVLDAAYHGHSTTLIDISPYKHNGPGGAGTPDWVNVAPLPDTYRGEFRNSSSAGSHFAKRVADIIDSLSKRGTGLCGFIAESCPSVAGQILLPAGYLAEVYPLVHDRGGICIADDVQTGYGRLGSVFYGFELQQVVPDIVVLGKPIGNGHPLAAVVTTREIAKAFDNGMEFFSTFGGNNVACRAGLAVLDVIEREGLQAKAAETGRHLSLQLNELKSRHDLIGDVRGSGLFWGIELVADQSTLEPAAREATFIVNLMREKGILLGTDGPLHNVIKIRPPMTFGLAEAELLVTTLDECFKLVPPR